MAIFDLADLALNLELKNMSEQKSTVSGGENYTMHTHAYVRMYKRTQFQMQVNVGGIQSYFASKYRPNVFNVPITMRASGIVSDAELEEYSALRRASQLDPFEDYGPAIMTVWYDEFLNPCRQILGSFIDNLLFPAGKIITSIQSGTDQGNDILNLVNDTNTGSRANYNNVNLSLTYNYKIFYPALSQQDDRSMSHSSSLDGRVVSLQISAQDKIYNLSKNMITYRAFAS